MKVANKVAAVLIVVGAAATASVNIGRYRARAGLFAETRGFNGERAFNDLQQLVQLGPRPPGSQALDRAREYISRQLSASCALPWYNNMARQSCGVHMTVHGLGS